jgi:hypothetical protein
MNIIPVIILTIIFNSVFDLYRHVWKYASIEELISVVYSISVTNIVFVIYSYFINYKFLENQYFRFPFTVHIIFWMLSTVFLGGTRFIFRIRAGMKKSSENNIEDESKTPMVLDRFALCLSSCAIRPRWWQSGTFASIKIQVNIPPMSEPVLHFQSTNIKLSLLDFRPTVKRFGIRIRATLTRMVIELNVPRGPPHLKTF